MMEDLWLVVRGSRKARYTRLSVAVSEPYKGPLVAKRAAVALTKATGVEHRIKTFTGQPLVPPGSVG